MIDADQIERLRGAVPLILDGTVRRLLDAATSDSDGLREILVANPEIRAIAPLVALSASGAAEILFGYGLLPKTRTLARRLPLLLDGLDEPGVVAALAHAMPFSVRAPGHDAWTAFRQRLAALPDRPALSGGAALWGDLPPATLRQLWVTPAARLLEPLETPESGEFVEDPLRALVARTSRRTEVVVRGPGGAGKSAFLTMLAAREAAAGGSPLLVRLTMRGRQVVPQFDATDDPDALLATLPWQPRPLLLVDGLDEVDEPEAALVALRARIGVPVPTVLAQRGEGHNLSRPVLQLEPLSTDAVWAWCRQWTEVTGQVMSEAQLGEDPLLRTPFGLLLAAMVHHQQPELFADGHRDDLVARLVALSFDGETEEARRIIRLAGWWTVLFGEIDADAVAAEAGRDIALVTAALDRSVLVVGADRQFVHRAFAEHLCAEVLADVCATISRSHADALLTGTQLPVELLYRWFVGVETLPATVFRAAESPAGALAAFDALLGALLSESDIVVRARFASKRQILPRAAHGRATDGCLRVLAASQGGRARLALDRVVAIAQIVAQTGRAIGPLVRVFGAGELPCVDLDGLESEALSLADVSETQLSFADLGGASLAWNFVRCANLTGASLKGADLQQAIFYRSIIDTCDLAGARLEGTTFIECHGTPDMGAGPEADWVPEEQLPAPPTLADDEWGPDRVRYTWANDRPRAWYAPAVLRRDG